MQDSERAQKVTLEGLVGEHVLTGVDFGTDEVDRYGEPAMANCCYFVLDGTTYRVVEDESDGYRSSMRDIDIIVDRPVVNVFEPCRVVGRYVNGKWGYGDSSDILELIDLVTGKTVLAVGTQNNDDYYPSYVADFTPEHMACNVVRRSDV